jgi:hypothetical protein
VWRNSCYSWPRLVCSQRGETEVRLPLGPWRASTSPASGHAVGTVRLQSAARSRRDKISLARSRRVAARRDEISLKRGSETAQALTGGRRHVQEGVLSSRRLRDRGTSKSENPGDPVSCSCVARARAGTGHSAARRPLPPTPLLASAPSMPLLDEVEFSPVRPPNVTDIDRVTNPAASSSRRSPQSRPVRDRTRPRASRSRATRPELTFRFVSSSVPGFRAIPSVCTSHGITRRGPRSGTRARRLRTPGAASALVARRRPVCVPVSRVRRRSPTTVPGNVAGM